MLALLINPDLQDITYVRYCPEDFESHVGLLRHLVGDTFQFEHAFQNGDYLYGIDENEYDKYAIGFEMDGLTDLLCGRAVVVSFDVYSGYLKSPLTTLSELRDKIHFYSREETSEIKNGELFRLLGC